MAGACAEGMGRPPRDDWERTTMDTKTTHVMPWRIEDIDLNRIDRQRAAANEDLLLLLCASSFIESGSDLYTSNLSQFFNDDPEVSAWLNNAWEHEELQHGRALKAYIAHVWPEFDWDTAFANFFAEYSQTCKVEAFEDPRARDGRALRRRDGHGHALSRDQRVLGRPC